MGQVRTQGRRPQSLHVSPKDRAAGVCGFTCQRECEASSGFPPLVALEARGRTANPTLDRSLDASWSTASAEAATAAPGPSFSPRGSSGCHAPRVPRLRGSGRDGAKREAPGEQPHQNRAGSPVPARPRLWGREAGVGAGAHARCHWTDLAYRLRSAWAHGSPAPRGPFPARGAGIQ